jgi:DNA-binding transcriptional LysR family regulator
VTYPLQDASLGQNMRFLLCHFFVRPFGDRFRRPYPLILVTCLKTITDEQEMGLTYQELDHFLLTGEEGENAAQLQNMMAASQHKRVMPPAPPLTSEDLDPPTEKCGEGVD